jgi:hypothetical protein
VKPRDFIIIGAQKAGTTSLFEYLRMHPGIYMPSEKEIPFFCDDPLYARGWDTFAWRYYASAPGGSLWGKVTPNYLVDPPVRSGSSTRCRR